MPVSTKPFHLRDEREERISTSSMGFSKNVLGAPIGR
jgi:hypothetical protein